MEKTIVNTSMAPAPIGPYNQAVRAGTFLFVSGQIALNPHTGELVTTDIIAETHQVMKNLEGILTHAGLHFNNIIKTTIFITDMNQFAAINEVYGSYFTGNYPARETVEVAALPKFVNVEISCIAAI